MPLIIHHNDKKQRMFADVQQKISFKNVLSGFKKRARAVNIPISTIRAIIKNFQST